MRGKEWNNNADLLGTSEKERWTAQLRQTTLTIGKYVLNFRHDASLVEW